MIKDIYFTSEYELEFRKMVWAESEVSLARCLSFTINTLEPTIVCDLRVTNYVSVIEFIKESFAKVWNHPDEATFKEQLLFMIRGKYKAMYDSFILNILPRLGYHDKLYKHQKDALFMMMNKQYNLLAAEQGLGKTNIAGSLSKLLGIKRTLIICPASLKWTWMKDLCGHISQFNEMYFSILDSNKSMTIKAFQERFVIVNYDSLEKWMPHILSSEIQHIIIDECTSIKSTSTNRFRKCAEIINANPNAKVSLLSGTPIRNRVNDFFAYLKITGHPMGTNYAKFMRDYLMISKGRGAWIKITGSKNEHQLWRNTSNFMIRKTKAECLDLPPKIYTKLHFDLNDYKSQYDKAVLDALEKSGQTNLSSSIHTINIVMAKAKLLGIIEFISNTIEQGEKIVVFSGYTEIIKSLENKFKDKCVVINGAVDSRERSVRVDKFMKDENCMVFIGQTLAAGTGLTLTSASNMIFCDLPFSPADLVQAEDRCHRIGATRTVNIYYAICDDSVDEDLYNLICDKAHGASRVVDNKMASIENIDNLSQILMSDLSKKYGKAELS